jgi:hypothetical protein
MAAKVKVANAHKRSIVAVFLKQDVLEIASAGKKVDMGQSVSAKMSVNAATHVHATKQPLLINRSAYKKILHFC